MNTHKEYFNLKLGIFGKILAHFSMGLILATLPSKATHGFALISSEQLPGTSFANLANSPNAYTSWSGDTITYSFDPSFLSHFSDERIAHQVRLAFNDWDNAWETPNGGTYSYNRRSGTQDFGDIRTIALHEIGHALGLHHPDHAFLFGRNYRQEPDAGNVTAQNPQGTEVLRSFIGEGEYNHILTHDELDAFRYVYGRDLDFVEVPSGTPADILISVFETVPGTWGQVVSTNESTYFDGNFRNPDDRTEGFQITGTQINFNTNATYPIGLQTLFLNWDYQNISGNPTSAFEVRTRGTNNPDPLYRYNGYPSNRFGNYSSTVVGENFKDDVLHSWSNPLNGPIDPQEIIHVGLGLDVWDWSVVSAQAIAPDGSRTNAPIIGFSEWENTIVNLDATLPDDLGNISRLPSTTLARGIRVVGSDTDSTVYNLVLAPINPGEFELEDLILPTLQDLFNNGRIAELPSFDLTSSIGRDLEAGEEFYLILEGTEEDLPEEIVNNGNFMLLNRPDIANQELFIFAQSRNQDAIIGNYGLINTTSIVREDSKSVLEPSMVGGLIFLGFGGLLGGKRRCNN